MIHFSDDVGFWSKFVFWFAFVNTVGTVAFTVVVIVGGIFDLKYLFRELRRPEAPDADQHQHSR